MVEISDEVKALISKEVNSTLIGYLKYFKYLGIGSLVALAALILAMTTNMAAGMAENIRAQVFAKIQTSENQLGSAVGEANQMIGRLLAADERLASVNLQISKIENDIRKLDNAELISNATAMLELLSASEDVNSLMATISSRITLGENSLSCGGSQIRIVSGQSDPNQTNWASYGNTNRFTKLKIDTSSAGFTKKPMYFVSLGGDGDHWSVSGSSAIYNSERTSFEIYLKNNSEDYDSSIPLRTYAATNRWYVNWLAVGC